MGDAFFFMAFLNVAFRFNAGISRSCNTEEILHYAKKLDVATDANNIFKHNYVILNYEAIILVLLILLPLLGFHIICKTGF